MTDRVKEVSRRLRDLCEPIAGAVYFLPEAQDEYTSLGFEGFGQSYFTSRGACLGRPSGQLVCAAFSVFNPDIVAILNTTMNQTGQAIEGTALIMACYLTVSLSISFFMNWYNKKIALVER